MAVFSNRNRGAERIGAGQRGEVVPMVASTRVSGAKEQGLRAEKLAISESPDISYLEPLVACLRNETSPLIILRTDETETWVLTELGNLLDYLEGRTLCTLTLSRGLVNIAKGDGKAWHPTVGPTGGGLLQSYLFELLQNESGVVPNGSVVVAGLADEQLWDGEGRRGASLPRLIEMLAPMENRNREGGRLMHLVIPVAAGSEVPVDLRKYVVDMPTPDGARREMIVQRVIERHNQRCKDRNDIVVVKSGAIIKEAVDRSHGMTCTALEKAVSKWLGEPPKLGEARKQLDRLPEYIAKSRAEDVSQMLKLLPKSSETVAPVGVGCFWEEIVGLYKAGVRIGSVEFPNAGILVGPPGTGKTIAMNALGREMGYLDVWEILSGYFLGSSYVGSNAQAWSRLRSELRGLGRSSSRGMVAFLDEAGNALAGGREDRSDAGWSQQGMGEVLKLLNECKRGELGPVVLFFLFNSARTFPPQFLDRAEACWMFNPFDPQKPEIIWEALRANIAFRVMGLEKEGKRLILDSGIDLDWWRGLVVGGSLRMIWNGRAIDGMLQRAFGLMARSDGQNGERILTRVVLERALTGASSFSMRDDDLAEYYVLATRIQDVDLGRPLTTEEFVRRYAVSEERLTALGVGGLARGQIVRRNY